MNSEEFVLGIKKCVQDAAVEDVVSKLTSPPGRKVSDTRKMVSTWYNKLSDEDRKYVKEVIEYSVGEAVFGLLAVLDGSRVFFDGRFEVFHVNGERVLINSSDEIGLTEVLNAID